MAQFQAVDSTVVANLGVAMYGNMYEDSISSPTTISVGSSLTYYGWQGATEGRVSGVTTDVSDGTADHFIIPSGGAGDYLVSYSISMAPAGTVPTLQSAVFIGSNEQAGTQTVAGRAGGAGEYMVQSDTSILTLADADEVSLRVLNRSDTSNINITFVAFTIYRLST